MKKVVPVQDAVLVIDDDNGIQSLMGVLLKRQNYEVDIAHDGEEALQKLRERTYAAILLDLMMPRVNGFEVLHELKALKPQILERTIVFTAASEATLRDFDTSHVFRLIRKPFDIQNVASAVNDCARQNGHKLSDRA